MTLPREAGRSLTAIQGGVAAVLAAATFVLLPMMTFGLGVLRTEGHVRLSALVAEEELAGAARAARAPEVWDAAVLYVNFTKGDLNAQIYRLTVGQLVLSSVLGLLVGLNLVVARRGGFGAATGAAATLCAATAGALGCCGGSAAVGMVTILGVSAPVAAVFGRAAWIIQLATIALLTANLVRLRRRAAAPAEITRRAPPSARLGVGA